MRNRVLVIYFVLAYAIAWAFMLPVALSAQGVIQADVPYSLYYLASFGPALALSAIRIEMGVKFILVTPVAVVLNFAVGHLVRKRELARDIL